MERTLVILKPDAVLRQILGDIITRFEHVGLKIVGCKMLSPSEQEFHHHYEAISKMISRHGQIAFDQTLEFMQAGPVIIMVLEGLSAIEVTRKLVGATYPNESAPGTIRGDYAHISKVYANANNLAVPNLVHASGNREEAEAEISHWFKKNELFEYETLHDVYTHAKHQK